MEREQIQDLIADPVRDVVRPLNERIKKQDKEIKRLNKNTKWQDKKIKWQGKKIKWQDKEIKRLLSIMLGKYPFSIPSSLRIDVDVIIYAL